MNRTFKRIAAVLMAAMLMFMSLGVLAAPEADVFARGGKIKMDTTVDVNADSLNSILAMFGMTSSGDDQDMQSVIIGTVLGLIRKLRVSTLTDGEAAYISIGNDNGELFNAYTSVGGEDGFVVTSLLPGLELSLPGAMMTAAFSKKDAEALMNSLGDYADVLTEYLTDELLPAAQLEEGSFDVSGFAFDSKVTLELHSHQLAGLLEGLLNVFKEDKALQEMLDAAIASGAAAAEAMGESVPGSKEFIEEFEESIADLKGDEDAKLANLTLYTDSESDAVYLDMEMLEEENPVILLTLAVLPDGEGSDVRISMLTADTWQEGPVDWDATRRTVLGGGQTGSVLFDIAFKQNTNETANREELKGSISIYAMGFMIGIDISSSSSIAGSYATEGSVAFSLFGMDPLFTVRVNGYETAEEIAAPSREGLKKIRVDQDLSEEAMNDVQQALMTSLPDLLERLKTVLPEEGPLLITIMESMMATGIPDQT